MTISTASAVGSAQPGQSSNLDIRDFLKILTSQLNNQDPLKPMDNQEFVAQIAQFATLEQSRQLNARIDSLVSAQSTAQSIGLLGRTVDFSQNGQALSGRVTGLALASGQPMLSITTASGTVANDISLSQLINIR